MEMNGSKTFKEGYVLAMYDVRGKQNFIFRTNKIKEIVGGSLIIRDIFEDYLYPAAREYRNSLYGVKDKTEAIYKYQTGEEFSGDEFKKPQQITPAISAIPMEKEFSCSAFKKRMEGNQYIGEVVYDGGGNFLVLYKSEEIFKGVNRIFTRKVLEEIGSLNILCTCVPVDDDLTDYRKDNEELYKKHEVLEASESVIRPVNGIPFVQIDPSTSMPLAEISVTVGLKDKPVKEDKVSVESAKKYAKYRQVAEAHSDEYGEKILDNLVKEKGKDSLLAVIFIDGNNMGAQVQNVFKDINGNECPVDYDTRVTKLRGFSAEIQKNYVDDRVKAIKDRLEQKYAQKPDKKRRMVVFAGDEMSFVVRAEDALDAVEAYFEKLGVDENNQPEERSSCAGIAIFHSHAPYAEAYKIAEECCETGKKHMKEQNPPETGTCYVDFQVCPSGMGRSLEDIRETETGELCSKPWLICDNGKNKIDTGKVTTIAEIKKIVADLNKIGSRTNVKTLVQAAENSLTEFNMEMERIYSHQDKDTQKEIGYTFGKEYKGKEPLECDERRRRMVYDIATVYDIWFR